MFMVQAPGLPRYYQAAAAAFGGQASAGTSLPYLPCLVPLVMPCTLDRCVLCARKVRMDACRLLQVPAGHPMANTPEPGNATTMKGHPPSAVPRPVLQTRHSLCLPITSSASENSGAELGDRQYSMRPSYTSNNHQSIPSHCNTGWTIQAHLGYRRQCCEDSKAAAEPISKQEDLGEDEHDSDDQADRRQGGSRPRKPHLQVCQQTCPVQHPGQSIFSLIAKS